jgi:small subunit ribosomal protein S18e
MPNHFLNRRRDVRSNKDLHVHANQIAQKWREDFDVWKKTRRHRGLRHLWQVKVRGQKTKTSGRGVSISAFRFNDGKKF